MTHAQFNPALSDVQQHEQWLREQYQRDLETLDRIEQQFGSDVDFFTAMADLSRARRSPE